MADEPAPKQGGFKFKSGKSTMLALVLGVTIVEAIGFYTATKLFGGGPQTTYGEEGQRHVLDGEAPDMLPATVEVELLKKFRVPNDKRGRLYVYDFDITAKVLGHRQEEVTQLVAERGGEIADRVARLVRSADPAVLREPELKTLRMQIQHAIGEVAGDQDVIVEVLIPRCVPTRHD